MVFIGSNPNHSLNVSHSKNLRMLQSDGQLYCVYPCKRLIIPGINASVHDLFEVPENGPVAVGAGAFVVLIGLLFLLR